MLSNILQSQICNPIPYSPRFVIQYPAVLVLYPNIANQYPAVPVQLCTEGREAEEPQVDWELQWSKEGPMGDISHQLSPSQVMSCHIRSRFRVREQRYPSSDGPWSGVSCWPPPGPCRSLGRAVNPALSLRQVSYPHFKPRGAGLGSSRSQFAGQKAVPSSFPGETQTSSPSLAAKPQGLCSPAGGPGVSTAFPEHFSCPWEGGRVGTGNATWLSTTAIRQRVLSKLNKKLLFSEEMKIVAVHRHQNGLALEFTFWLP